MFAPMDQRQPPYRSEKWLALVRRLEYCVLCHHSGIQAAHRNAGKGMGQKTDDSLVAALCVACHTELDNGKSLSRDERRARMDHAICLTISHLSRNGWIGPL